MTQNCNALPEGHATLVRLQPQRNVHINQDLSSCTHVFIRNDSVRKPLQTPYDGPYKVFAHSENYFTIDCKGRLEPAYLDSAPEIFESPP
jgi:cleavage and polyadenylation specificity factor subunit 1